MIVELYGATTSDLQDEHRVDVRVNGQFVGTTRFKGMGTHRAEFELPQQALAASENDVELEAVLEGAPYSIVYVDGVEVRYARRYVADGNRLWFHDAGNPIVSPRGFTSSDLVVLDISDSDRPRRLSITAQGLGDFSFDMVPRVGSRYVAVTVDTIDPAGVEPWDQPASQLHGRHSIDYLVITHESLRGGAEALADYRRSTGLDSMVVTVEEIENEFASGFPTPHAIRDFLRYTNDRWLRAPRYVVLVGEGSWDYRNVYGLSDSLVPPLMELGTNGIYASDNSLADVVGDDALPEMAIGRIPVATTEELDAYVAKVRAFEARGRDQRLLLLSDTDDRGGLFQEDVRSIAPTNAPLQEVSLNDLPIAAARSALLTALGEGGGVVTYSGHGGLDRLAMGGLMLSSDVAQLKNLDRLPILISMSCSTNRFSVTGFDSLGENLVQEETGGAIAVWAPTGLTAHAQTKLLVGPFLERVYGDSERLGDAVLGALQDYAQKADSERLLTVFTLLGDPALRIN